MILSVESLATLSIAFSCFALWSAIGILALTWSHSRRRR